MSTKSNISKQLLAEAFGTFLIVLLGCGSAVLAGDKVGFLGISFAFGLAVVAGAYSIGSISGGHFNPAVTLAMCLKNRTSWSKFVPYVLAQVFGAIVASLALLAIASGKVDYDLAINGLGQNGYGDLSPAKFGLLSGFIFETLFTAIFVLVILGVTKTSNNFAGWIIGMTLTVIHIVGIPVTGVSVNPARSIGPALFAGAGAMSQLWLFIAAPMLGGLLAAVIWGLIDEKESDPIELPSLI
jgi:aquaporin Z